MAILALANCGAQEIVSSKYDKFKDATWFDMAITQTGPVMYGGKPDPLISKVKLGGGFYCPGHSDSCSPEAVEVLFIATTRDWVFGDLFNRKIRFLADNKSLEGGTADWDGRVMGAEDLTEYLNLVVSPELIRTLANAKAVDVQAGIFEFSLTSENLQALSALAGHITAKAPVTARGSALPPNTMLFDPALLTPAALNAKAPDTFDVKFVTTKGEFVVHVTRDWAPHGADRFYNLVKHHYFDGCAFFRVIRTPGPFMAQFGLTPYPEVNKAWMNANIPDDAVKQNNTRGKVTFAALPNPNTRSTQLFINFGDNSFLDQSRFAPFGEVVSSMDVVDKINDEYVERPDQEKITMQGRAYLTQNFPNLDYIKTARIVTTSAPAATPKSPGN